jgi:hypothetical protein
MEKIHICGLALAIGLVLSPQVLSAQKRTYTPADSGLPQAIVAYGYLRWDYLEFDQLVALIPDLALASDLRSLDKSLDSLHCDVPKRMAPPHETLILPPFPITQWFGFDRPSRNSPDDGWLFVTQAIGSSPQRVLVVLSSSGAEQTTVFWLEHSDKGYAAKLLFDSFTKGKIANETTVVGAATFVSFEGESAILLKEFSEPGSGPFEHMMGRVFRLDLMSGTMTLVSPGVPPKR